MNERAEDWDAAYAGGDAPPWDIGRPQPVLEALAAQGRLAGSLLDCGCGTGEHTLLAAEHGATAWGVDLSPTAIQQAREKAADRGLDARFDAGDVLELPLPTATFDTVVDCGLFHSLDDDDRVRYVRRLADVTRPGATCYLMCFSERQPGTWGPRRVTEAELRAAFLGDWAVERIEPARFEINPLPDVSFADAWLGTFRRQD